MSHSHGRLPSGTIPRNHFRKVTNPLNTEDRAAIIASTIKQATKTLTTVRLKTSGRALQSRQSIACEAFVALRRILSRRLQAFMHPIAQGRSIIMPINARSHQNLKSRYKVAGLGSDVKEAANRRIISRIKLPAGQFLEFVFVAAVS